MRLVFGLVRRWDEDGDGRTDGPCALVCEVAELLLIFLNKKFEFFFTVFLLSKKCFKFNQKEARTSSESWRTNKPLPTLACDLGRCP